MTNSATHSARDPGQSRRRAVGAALLVLSGPAALLHATWAQELVADQTLRTVSAQTLADTAWQAHVIHGLGLVQDVPPRLRWIGPTRVQGSGGCNDFAGSVALGPNESLRVVSLAPVGRPCAAAPGGQEDLFFRALERTRQARLEGEFLIFLDDAGQTLMELSAEH
jgi:heat shock protein HslJ